MKGKFSLIWRVVIALVLVLSFSLVAAVPAAASPDVSDVWVDLDVYTKNTSTIYHVYFTPGADLTKNVDTITVFFPADTGVPQGSVTANLDPDGDAVTKVAVTATASGAGYRVTVTTPEDITAGTEVRLDISAVTNPNPGSATAYTLEVFTSQETTKVESSSYTIPATLVLNVNVAPTTETAGEVSVYTIDFDEASQGQLAVWDTVTVIFPTGTGIPSSIASSKVTIQSDDTNMDDAAIPLDVAPVVDGRFVTLTVPEVGWLVSDGTGQLSTDIQIVFLETAGITNPTVADDGENVHDGDYIGKVYTSDDLAIEEDGSRYDIKAASVSQVVFDAVTSDSSVVVSSATVTNEADLKIQTKDQYGNLKGVPTGVTVTFDLTSSSTTGLFRTNGTWDAVSDDIANGANSTTFKYKDTTAGTATITAENAAHGWSDTWEIEVTSETAVELWDGDTLVGEYTTITLAIDDALAGNTIKVGPGTYTPASTLTISQEGLTLESTDGAEVTIIDASGVSIAIDIQAVAKDVTVDGFTVQDADTRAIQTLAEGTIIQNNIITNEACKQGINLGSTASDVTVSGNELDINSTMYLTAGVSTCTLSGNTFGAGINLTSNNSGITITGNTIIGSEYEGISFQNTPGGTYDDILIQGNTISETTLSEAVGIYVRGDTVTNLVIKGNDITDNGIGIKVTAWTTASDAIKFNTISGNTEYGIENTASDVDATHNWWGDDTGPSGVGPGSGDAINTTDVDCEPWLLATVSAGEFATDATSLNAQATVGVRVSGADTAKICAARYTENPMATPEFTPLENGFFDVYVSDAGSPTEIGIKFYDAAITSDSVLYVWDAFEEVWTECSDQAYNATYGYIWVKVRPAGVDVPTVPTISDLAGTPFAISGVPVKVLESISAEPSSVTLDVDETQQLTVTATYSDASTADVTADSTYASDDETVATVSTGGLITGVAEDGATITVSYTEGGITKTTTVPVTVEEFDLWVYDVDEDGVISKTEALNAVVDYFDLVITKDQALQVIVEYMG